jgi:CRISPR system Cascade subunit CasC
MFIQIHALQSFPPGNLNRDDRGQPKSALFGGVTRGRISSQCLKRRMRESAAFQQLDRGVGVRTRQLPALVGKALRAKGVADLDDDKITQIELKIASAFKKEGAAGEDAGAEGVQTGQLVFFPLSFADLIASAIADAAGRKEGGLAEWLEGGSKKDKKEKKPAKLAESEGDAGKKDKIHPLDLAIKDASRLITVDIGMFGRMTTSELVDDVEAACQVAHAISTHEVRIERDYFTAMDDLSRDKGAGFVSGGDTSTFFNSAVYYRYLNLDLQGLGRNVCIDGRASATTMLSDAELANAACALLNAVVHAGPTAKQNNFAAHSVPEFLLCEIAGRRQPLSYANAFLESVALHGEGSLMARSAARLRAYVADVASRFEPEGLSRVALAAGDARGVLAGAQMVERYADLEQAMRKAILSGAR